jgi:hypothetical protein
MRFWRDPAKRADRLRQRHGLIVKGKRISCPPHYALPNNDYDPLHHDYEHGFPAGVDSQPASISPTIKISIIFICLFLVNHAWIICQPAIKNDSSAILSMAIRSAKRDIQRLSPKFLSKDFRLSGGYMPCESSSTPLGIINSSGHENRRDPSRTQG